MPSSVLGIDNHLALAIDVAMSSIYDTNSCVHHRPGPFMFGSGYSLVRSRTLNFYSYGHVATITFKIYSYSHVRIASTCSAGYSYGHANQHEATKPKFSRFLHPCVTIIEMHVHWMQLVTCIV